MVVACGSNAWRPNASTKPDAGEEAIELTVDELNWLLDGIDWWRNRPHQVLTPRYVACVGIIQRHERWRRLPANDPVLLKMLLLAQGKVAQLQEQNALLLQRLFGRKSEQTVDPDSPQLPLLNEAEALFEVAPCVAGFSVAAKPSRTRL